MNVSSATTLAHAFDMAAADAAASQSGGKIAANTGVIDWFQYGGNTYVLEAINSTASAAATLPRSPQPTNSSRSSVWSI